MMDLPDSVQVRGPLTWKDVARLRDRRWDLQYDGFHWRRVDVGPSPEDTSLADRIEAILRQQEADDMEQERQYWEDKARLENDLLNEQARYANGVD